ncbi:endolytic transglycosylase MltG [Reinekea sp.]|uniref:endolytic transglycosylase MltG n=1 Tax=Reinekea sp. TaxID=1970455 RepID=UPI002A83EEB2|nr:endolytic transglycosylase MltG [Reinekea sp.]
MTVLTLVSLAQQQLQQPLALSADSTTYRVPAGASLKRVLADFTAKGWIGYPRVHELWLRYNKLTTIQRGEYAIKQGQTSGEVIAMMVSGEKILRSVQFIEGKTFADFLLVLAASPDLEQSLIGLTPEEVMHRVAADLDFYEGWFFPDTYLFESGTRDLEILKLAHKRMVTVLASEWAEKSPTTVVQSPYEALILASIIEKETGAAFERPMIAGVFSRRLSIDMRLQTDPTVIYGAGDSYTGNLTRRHLRTDTAYNTYTRKGLPPTPIANPGREAIFAALNPEPGESVFFVAKGDGTHQFSTTLKEHNAAVRRYQRFSRRQDYQSAPSSEAGQ